MQYKLWLLIGLLTTVGCKSSSEKSQVKFDNISARLFWDSFETGGWKAKENKAKTGGSVNFGPEWWQSQVHTDQSAVVKDDSARHGRNYMAFTWFRNKYGASEGVSENSSKKAMLFAPRESTKAVDGKHRWYSFSFWVPQRSDGAIDQEPYLMVQWQASRDRLSNGSLGEPARFPPLSLHNVKGRLKLRGYYQQERYSGDHVSSFKELDLGPVYNTINAKRHRWVDMIVKLKFDCCSQNPGGSIEIWRRDIGQSNGFAKVADLKDIYVGYNDAFHPFMGVGIYSYTSTSSFDERRINFDNVKVGDHTTEFSDLD